MSIYLENKIFRTIIFLLSCLTGTAFYLGMRYSNIPASHLSLALVPCLIVVSVITLPWMKVKKIELSILSVVLFLLFMTGLFVSTPNGLIISFGAIGASFFIVSSYLFSRALSAISVTYYFTAFMFWIVAIPALFNIVKGEPHLLKEFFANSSENIVSSWLIITSSAMMSSRYYEKGELVLLPFLFTALISFVLYTRASIAVSFILLSYAFYLRFGKGLAVGFVILIIISTLVFLKDTYSILFSLVGDTKFFSSGFESARWSIWSAYLSELDAVSLLLGMDVSFVPEIKSYSSNPHSSIIRFHSFYGVSLLLAAIIFIIWAAFKSKFIHVVMFLAIFGRASTDILLFGIFFDVFLMIVILNMLRSQRGAN